MDHHPLESLKRYDAIAIAEFYNRRPWLAIWRALQVVLAFLGFVIGLKWDEWTGANSTQMTRRAEQLRRILINLGPTYIKVGQALSTRPDLVRQDFLEELIKLQDQLPPFANTIAFNIIESQLGRSVEAMYRSMSPEPVAAASLGQVYRAQLYSGEEVAVKVQRPGLMPVLTLDLYLMRWAASWIGPWLPLNLGHGLTEIVDEFGVKLFEEVDYLNEGRNAEKFATNFRNDPQVKVPSIFWRYSNQRVLTLEWIDGCKLTNLEQVCMMGLDRDTLIKIGVTSGLQQLLEHGFFHADPHPGNLFAVADSSTGQTRSAMAYIDFGMMDQLEESAKETLVDAVVHLVNKDYEELAKDFVRLGFLTPETDIRPIIPALENVFDNAFGESVRDFNFKSITDRFSSLMYEYPFRLPAKFALIIRSLVTQEGLALTLNPDFRILDVAYPYIANRLLTGESPQLRRRLLEVLFKNGKFQWSRLENLIAIARTDNNFDLLPTAQLGIQYLLSDEGKFLRREILMALIADDRLHTQEVQRLWNLVKDDLKPDRLMSAALGVLAEFAPIPAPSFIPSALSFIKKD